MSTVLFVHNAYRIRAGEDAVADDICRILADRGHRVIRWGVSSRELLDRPLPARMAAGLHAFFSVPAYRALHRLVARERPALALVQNVFPFLSPSVYHALAHRGVPVVQNVFNYRFVCPAATLYTGGRSCERCVGTWTLPCVLHRCYRDSRAWSALYAAIIGLHRRAGTFARPALYALATEALRGPLVRGGLPGDRMVRIPNAFDAAPYAPGPTAGRYVLYVGRLDPEKGVGVLLEAMAEAPGLPLKVVGRGTEEGALRKRAGALETGRVEFLGPVYGEAVVSLLREARVVVVPSVWQEISPVVILQAQACARPVIASRVGGLPEMVADGADGLLVEPGDARALAAAIRALAGDPDRAVALGRAARDRVVRESSPDRYYERLREAVSRFIRPGLL